MAYQQNNDPRVHLTPDEKLTLGQKIVAFAKAEVAKDFPGAPACSACTGQSIVAAYVMLADEVRLSGTSRELNEVANASKAAAAVVETTSEALIISAITRGVEDGTVADPLAVIMSILAGRPA